MEENDAAPSGAVGAFAPDKNLLSVGEVAALTRRSTATIQRGIRSGALKSVKIYNARLIPRDAAKRWMRAARARAAA